MSNLNKSGLYIRYATASYWAWRKLIRPDETVSSHFA